MKYLSFANSGKPINVDGAKQELRRARRSGSISARQQIKQAKSDRRAAKIIV